MRYRLLGNSGLRVSEAALGTMTFGDDWGWGSAKDEARKVYDAFREAGGNFIDSANLYTNGTSESFLGEFIQSQRERIVLATKYTNALPTTSTPSGSICVATSVAISGPTVKITSSRTDSTE